MKILSALLTAFVLLSPFRLICQEYLGFWNGELNMGDAQSEAYLRVVYELEKTDSLRAWFTSPDQGSERYPCDIVRVDKDSIIIGLTKYSTTFRGKFNKKEQTIAGNIHNGPMEMPLTLIRTRIEKRIKNRPQTPVPPYPYKETECVFTNAKAGISFSGTLTTPEGKGPFPCAILISGSGAQDRNESLADHQPFRVLADHLSRNGIAVLRYDDRGVGGSGGNVVSATSADFASDALAAFRYLSARKDIDPARIGLIGHSEGGLVASLAAMKEPQIAFVVSMAGPGLPGREILADQTIDIETREGVSLPMAQQHAKEIDDILRIVESEPDSAKASVKIDDFLTSEKADMALLMENFDNYKVMRNTFFNNPWMRFFAFYDPHQSWSMVRCPVLAINGSLDLQVNARKNLDAISAALENGGNTRYTTMIFEGLNHLFQPTETGRIFEYQQIETTIEPQVLETISTWITEHSK